MVIATQRLFGNFEPKETSILSRLTEEKLNDIVIESMRMYYDESINIKKIRKVFRQKYKFEVDLNNDDLLEFVRKIAENGPDVFYKKFTGLGKIGFAFVTKDIPDDNQMIFLLSRILDNTFITTTPSEINLDKSFTKVVANSDLNSVYTLKGKFVSDFKYNNINVDNREKNILQCIYQEENNKKKIKSTLQLLIDMDVFSNRERRYKLFRRSNSGIICIGIYTLLALIQIMILKKIENMDSKSAIHNMYNFYNNPYLLHYLLVNVLREQTRITDKTCIATELKKNEKTYKLKNDLINKFLKDIISKHEGISLFDFRYNIQHMTNKISLKNIKQVRILQKPKKPNLRGLSQQVKKKTMNKYQEELRLFLERQKQINQQNNERLLESPNSSQLLIENVTGNKVPKSNIIQPPPKPIQLNRSKTGYIPLEPVNIRINELPPIEVFEKEPLNPKGLKVKQVKKNNKRRQININEQKRRKNESEKMKQTIIKKKKQQQKKKQEQKQPKQEQSQEQTNNTKPKSKKKVKTSKARKPQEPVTSTSKLIPIKNPFSLLEETNN
jgi:hypothetical protein